MTAKSSWVGVVFQMAAPFGNVSIVMHYSIENTIPHSSICFRGINNLFITLPKVPGNFPGHQSRFVALQSLHTGFLPAKEVMIGGFDGQPPKQPLGDWQLLEEELAGPCGDLRPCSQFCRVLTLIPISLANSLWDKL
jgi:hypothetical protein